MENIIFAAEDLFGHVLESENGVLLISCFNGTISDIKKRYMTVLAEEINGSIVFTNDRMNLDLGEAVADFYERSGSFTNYTPLNKTNLASNINSSSLKELIRVPIKGSDNVFAFSPALKS